MDFEKLLHVARKNELSKKEPTKCLTTKFKPPTKEQREKDKMLSEGVQKFLKRKEEEDRRKQIEAERRKEELIALRAKDPKALKRIQTMLKRTKSANKSVMEDAVDNNNTADTLAGPSQPDEDDYGFVSETSSQLYNKLIQKMYSTPDDAPKFAPSKKPNSSNLVGTKERVKMALLKQEEEEKLPHKRKRKGKEKDHEGEDDGDVHLDYSAPDRDLSNGVSDRDKSKSDKPKIRKPMPPPVDFRELLKIAEQKQHEPVTIEPKVKKVCEPEVLMTKKQKLEYEKQQEWKKHRELRLQSLQNGGKQTVTTEDKKIPKIPKVNQPNKETKAAISQKIPKINIQDDKVSGGKGCVKSLNRSQYKSNDTSEKFQKSKSTPEHKSTEKSEKEKRDKDDETERLRKERDEVLRILKEKERQIKEREEAARLKKEKEQLILERDNALRKIKMLEESEKKRSLDSKLSDSKSRSEKSQKPIPKSLTKPETSKMASPNGKLASSKTPGVPGGREFPPKDVARPGGREFPPKDVARPGGREFPPRDLKNVPKATAGPLQRGRQFPPGDVRRKAQSLKRGRVVDSDDEHDSELDDFIDDDDGGVQTEDVSKVISEIFRYDKNKYSRYDDADDECMESNFAQISKEEFFSAKCGLLEDLKDIQQEKAMLARKKKR